MKKILITGAFGQLGRALTRELENENILLLSDTVIPPNSDGFQLDITDRKLVKESLPALELDLIVNLAAMTDVDGCQSNPDKAWIVNSTSVKNLLDFGQCPLIHISSDYVFDGENGPYKESDETSPINVYGENLERPSLESDPLKPETNYGHVKMLTEMMYKHFAERYDLDITILRLANLYGENKKAGFVSKLLNSINSPNEKLKPHNFGNQEMDVLHIDDAVNGIIKAINTNLNGFHIINISSGMKYSIKQMIKIIEKISKKQMLIEYVEQRDAEICIWANNMKAKKILNFEPNLPIEEGFRLTIQSILKN